MPMNPRGRGKRPGDRSCEMKSADRGWASRPQLWLKASHLWRLGVQADSLSFPHFPSHPGEGLAGGEQARLVGALTQRYRSWGGGAEALSLLRVRPGAGPQFGAFPDIPGGGAATGVESRSLSHREADGGEAVGDLRRQRHGHCAANLPRGFTRSLGSLSGCSCVSTNLSLGPLSLVLFPDSFRVSVAQAGHGLGTILLPRPPEY